MITIEIKVGRDEARMISVELKRTGSSGPDKAVNDTANRLLLAFRDQMVADMRKCGGGRLVEVEQ